jgi:hypothetical protein
MLLVSTTTIFKAGAQDSIVPPVCSDRTLVNTITVPESPIKNILIARKHFSRGLKELFAAQLLPWSYNRYVRKAEFAKISFGSIGTNLKPSSWQWDDNKFINNHISHPYHGNIYFNAFRTNGYGFWRSVPGTFGGTLFWELLCETHYPAPNDMVNTSLGGIAIGEMTYRLSNALVKRPHSGLKGQFLEALAFIVNPLNGYNRIADKKWNRFNRDNINQEDFLAENDIGSRQYVNRSNGKIEKWKNELFTSINLEYGNPFKNIKTPFGYFSTTIEAGSSAQLNMVRIKAPLYGWDITSKGQSNHITNITMSFDFYKNQAFAYSAESFHYNLVSMFKKGVLTQARTSIGAGVIALAAVPNEYLYYGEGRNYDYGCGLGIATAARLVISNRLIHIIQYRRGWFKTINGFNSSYFLGTTNSELKYKLWKNFLIAFEWGTYFLKGRYVGLPDINKRYTYVRTSMEYTFTL